MGIPSRDVVHIGIALQIGAKIFRGINAAVAKMFELGFYGLSYTKTQAASPDIQPSMSFRKGH